MYKVVIGLETHCELKTNTKCFCGCQNHFGGEPNTHCCPVCVGMPGSLPILNKTAVEYAIKAGLAVGCKINEYSVFERKNYFYPDLAKAYQISQLEYPLCVGGGVEIEVDGNKKFIRLDRIHLEEDAAKLIHSKSGTKVDYNRGGVPLIEIVSMPDLSSAEEAVAYLKKLRSTLLYLGVSDCKMQEGSLKCDVNVSIHKEGEPFGTRTEMKNLNSFSAIYRAIKSEAKRQQEELEKGNKIVQETRRWDDNLGKSFSMRSKEDAQDYRYFPDPDIVPILVEKDYVNRIAKELPKMAPERAKIYVCDFGLSEKDAKLLTDDKYISDYFEDVLKDFNEPKFVCNWMLGEVFKKLNSLEQEDTSIEISPQNMAKLLKLYKNDTIGQSVARKLLDELWGTQDNPEEVVKKQGLTQMSDTNALEEIIKAVMDENPKAVQELKAGNGKTMAFFVGQAMKRTAGKANPKLVNEIVQKLIN